MDEQGYEIPRRLNDPPKLFFWDMDIAVLFSTCFILGAISGSAILGSIAGLALGHHYGKLKSGKHPAYAVHLAYWHLPIGKMNRVPPSHIRELLG